MIRFRKLALLLASLSILLSCAEVFAQTGTTSVQGTVVDNSGAAVVAAKVVIQNAQQALEREIQTNGSGEYKFLALPPGTYAITVEKAGFRKYESHDVALLVNLPVTLTGRGASLGT